MGLISFDQTSRIAQEPPDKEKSAPVTPQKTTDLEQMTKRELRKLAVEKGVDLELVPDRKADIIAAIEEGAR
jgi:hypothetical protein